jgi:phage/plasmid-like protein (TIGR03299 family)
MVPDDTVTNERGNQMAHEIETNDKGVVFGETWHKLEQYAQLDHAPTYEEVKACMEFGVELQQVQLMDGTIVPNNFAFQRMDDKSILQVNCVTNDYKIVQHSDLVEMVQNSIMIPNPGVLDYDSAGTLNAGRRAFINLKALQFKVDGDGSDTMTHLMVSNCHGMKAASVCCSSVRVVCANTFRMAELQGVANNTFKKFRHIGGVNEKIKTATIELGELMTGIKFHHEQLNKMSQMELTDTEAVNIINAIFPSYDENDKKESWKNVLVSRKELIDLRRGELFDTYKARDNGSMTDRCAKSRYGFFQAVTRMADHPEDYFGRHRIDNEVEKMLVGVGESGGGRIDAWKQNVWTMLNK